jgi:hypothetical protein
MGSASRASWAVFRRARAVSDCWRRKGGDDSYRVGALLAGQSPSTAAPIRVFHAQAISRRRPSVIPHLRWGRRHYRKIFDSLSYRWSRSRSSFHRCEPRRTGITCATVSLPPEGALVILSPPLVGPTPSQKRGPLTVGDLAQAIRSIMTTAVGSISQVLPFVLPMTVRRMSTVSNTSESNSRTECGPAWFVATVQCG